MKVISNLTDFMLPTQQVILFLWKAMSLSVVGLYEHLTVIDSTRIGLIIVKLTSLTSAFR